MNGTSSDLPPDKENGDCQGRVVNVVVEVIIEAKTRSDGEKGGSQSGLPRIRALKELK